MREIILASASPRRSELLRQIGIPFSVKVSKVDEQITEEMPDEIVRQLAHQKAWDVFRDTEDSIVIGADTIVVWNNTIMGKPQDDEDAYRMLEQLQGNTHSVYTGVSILYLDEKQEIEVIFSEQTRVTMYPMEEEEINWYIKTREPEDKAGAYGIQGYGASFIKGIHGDYNTVVGLPVSRVYQELKRIERIHR